MHWRISHGRIYRISTKSQTFLIIVKHDQGKYTKNRKVNIYIKTKPDAELSKLTHFFNFANARHTY